uniref:Putative gag protein n=1 Tax=Coprinopsis cinerea TaxID=5346 RepID=Q6IM98_COPCI|nr:TPA_exp: putative gag protein [Coprinopsis cinerea]
MRDGISHLLAVLERSPSSLLVPLSFSRLLWSLGSCISTLNLHLSLSPNFRAPHSFSLVEKFSFDMADGGAEGSGGGGEGTGGAGGVAAAQDIRTRKTHADDRVSRLLSSMALHLKLQMNKRIEEENDQRTLKNLAAAQGNGSTSTLASEVTIPDDDIDDLRDMTAWEAVKGFCSRGFTITMSAIHRRDREEEEERRRGMTLGEQDRGRSKKKRRYEEDSSDSDGDGMPQAKKALLYLDPADEQNFAPGGIQAKSVPFVLLNTEIVEPVPLRWLTESNWRWISEHSSKLPTTTAKVFNKIGATVSLTVIDVQKVLTQHGMSSSQKTELAHLAEESPRNYGEFVATKANMLLLQSKRQQPGEDHQVRWYEQHYDNYLNRPEISEEGLFQRWIAQERRDRLERRSYPTPYDKRVADLRWEVMLSSYRAEQDNRSFRNPTPPKGTTGPPSGSSGGRRASEFIARRKERNQAQQESSDCVVCGVTGHTAKRHDFARAPRFRDGREFYVKKVGGSLVQTNAPYKEVCITWNAVGPDARCSHNLDERLHVCSFCGDGQHHALSRTCRN